MFGPMCPRSFVGYRTRRANPIGRKCECCREDHNFDHRNLLIAHQEGTVRAFYGLFRVALRSQPIYAAGSRQPLIDFDFAMGRQAELGLAIVALHECLRMKRVDRPADFGQQAGLQARSRLRLTAGAKL
jgi:hypothetical protein